MSRRTLARLAYATVLVLLPAAFLLGQSGVGHAQPKPAAPVVVSAPPILRPLQLPVFSRLPPLCSEGQMVMLHDERASKLHVCETESSSQCTSQRNVTHRSCVPEARCRASGGQVLAADPEDCRGPISVTTNVTCETTTTQCTAYQTNVNTRWVRVGAP